MALCVWITGLPGSGKSTISKHLIELLNKNGEETEYLRLDEFRRKIIPNPEYSDEERDFVYNKLIFLAKDKSAGAKILVIDATAHKKKYREKSKNLIKDFLEVFVKCNLNECIKRESSRPGGLVAANLYNKALERRKTGKKEDGLGLVVGVDVPFEEGGADIVVDSNKNSALECAEFVFKEISRRKKGND